MKRFIISLLIGSVSILNSFSQSRDFGGILYNKALKVEILSPLSNHLGINYEHKVSTSLSWEIKAGIVGLGLDWDPAYEEGYTSYGFALDQNGQEIPVIYDSKSSKTREKGLFLRVGPKLMLQKSENLSGLYIYPSAFYSHSAYSGARRHLIRMEDGSLLPEQYSEDYSYEFGANSMGVLFNLGYQAQMFERLLFDINIGAGYAHNMDKYEQTNLLEDSQSVPFYPSDTYYNPGLDKFFRYSHMGLGPYGGNGTIAINMGISLGYAF